MTIVSDESRELLDFLLRPGLQRGRVALEQLMVGGKLPSRRQEETSGHSPLHSIMGEVDALSHGRAPAPDEPAEDHEED